jgi:CysZ protein
MIDDALASLREMFSPPFRAVLFKVLALTLALLAALWLVLEHGVVVVSAGGAPWLLTLIEITAAIGLLIGVAFLVAPVSMLVAGFFLDDLADHVEANIYPPGQGGKAAPVSQSLWLAIKFTLVALGVNFVAFCLWLIPGVNALVFFVANAYLFSREYFELAAMRFRPLAEVRALRRAHRWPLFLAGLLIALFVATPVLNLLTPLFGMALMVRMHKRLAPPSSQRLLQEGA